jgi:hypothetical protein
MGYTAEAKGATTNKAAVKRLPSNIGARVVKNAIGKPGKACLIQYLDWSFISSVG